MTPLHVRQRLIDAEAARIALVTDGQDPRLCSRRLNDRLYALQSGQEVTVSGALVGAALGLGVLDRAASYRLSADDELVPVTGRQGRGHRRSRRSDDTAVVGAGRFLELTAGEYEEVDDDAA